MADFGSPVAQNVNPMGQGLTTLNDLMNFKRSKQALQIGQQTLEAGTAEAQQAQQRNQELQKLSAFTRNASRDPAYHNPDGSLNVQKYQTDAMAAAPVYGQAYIGQMTSNANAMVENRKALLGLSNDQRSTLGNYFGAVAAKPNATREDFLDAAEQARSVSDDPQYQRSVDRMLMSAPDVRQLPTEQASGAIRQWARGIAMETSAPDAAMSGPNVQMVQGKEGLVPTNVNPMAPGGVGPVGAPQQQGLAPTEQPGYKRTVAGVAGEVQSDSDRFTKVMGAAANSQSGIALADQVGALAQQVRTGKLSKDWADRLAVLQQQNPQITARQMLGKYASQLQTLAEGNAASDAERAQIKSGMPDPDTMDPDAVRKAAQYLHGYFRMSQDRGRNAIEHVNKNGVPGLTVNDTQFSGQRDPLVYAFKDMPRADQKGFLLERFGHGKSKALDEFERQVNSQ